MKCERCGGLTINMSFSSGMTALEAWEYDGWKCLNCGYVTDPLILKNKAAHPPRIGGRGDATFRTMPRTHASAQVAA